MSQPRYVPAPHQWVLPDGRVIIGFDKLSEADQAAAGFVRVELPPKQVVMPAEEDDADV